jgi:hypothetical protein
MSKFHFFTDTDLLGAQASGKQFGATLTQGGNDLFRITDLHTASADPNVYATCGGLIVAQEDSLDSSLVHLILKPDAMPVFNCQKIQYILFKGVLRSSLLDSSDEVIVDPNNNLVTSIKASQDAYNISYDEAEENPPGTTQDKATKNVLGLNINGTTSGFGDSESIDKLFYRTTEFQLPTVKPGWVIGKFDSGGFGIEIILETIDYPPKLSLTRNLENHISVPSLTGSESNFAHFDHFHKKEAIHAYMDPCAFWGGFFTDRLDVHLSNGTSTTKTEYEIYDDVLIGSVNFINKNKIYLDIRNEHNKSFNYYRNYANDVEISYDFTSSFTTMDYYANGWPICVLNNLSLPSGVDDDYIPLKLKLPEGDNNEPLVYFITGFRKLLRPLKLLKGRKRFVHLDIDNGLTSEVEFSIPNRGDISTTTPVCSSVTLKYLRRLYQDGTLLSSEGTKIEGNYYFDNLFLPVQMLNPFAGQTGTSMRVYENYSYVDHFKDKREYIANVGIANDDLGVFFFAHATERSRIGNGMKDFFSFSTEYSNAQASFLEMLSSKYGHLDFIPNYVEVSSDKYQIVEIDKAYDNYLQYFKLPPVSELVILFLNQDSLDSIQDVITTEGLLTDYNIFLGLANQTFQTDDNERAFFSYDIVLKGFIENAGDIVATEINTTIKTYHNESI